MINPNALTDSPNPPLSLCLSLSLSVSSCLFDRAPAPRRGPPNPDSYEAQRIKELEAKVAEQQAAISIQKSFRRSSISPTRKQAPETEQERQELENERRRLAEDRQRAQEEREAFRKEMIALKASVTRQPVAASPSGVVAAGMSEEERAAQEALDAQQSSEINNLRKEMLRSREEQGRREAQQREQIERLRRESTKALESSMEKLREDMNSPERLANMPPGSPVSANDPGLVTVRRGHNELKKQYKLLQERVEAQQKLIKDMQTKSMKENKRLMDGQMQGSAREMQALKDELMQMKQQMMARDAAVEFEQQQRKEMEDRMDEELRLLLVDQAGVFGGGKDPLNETPRPPMLGAATDQTPMSTDRIIRMGPRETQSALTPGGTLNLDEIISGAGGSGAAAPGPRRGGGGGGGQELSGTLQVRPAGGMRMAGESLSSQSKFIFPDGHSAPDVLAPPARGGGGGGGGGGIRGAGQVPPLDLRNSGIGASLGAEEINPMTVDTTRSMDVTALYEANNSKLDQLQQLSANPEDPSGQDHLDRLLVDFLNKKMDPHDDMGRGGSAPGGGRGAGTLRSESRFVR